MYSIKEYIYFFCKQSTKSKVIGYRQEVKTQELMRVGVIAAQPPLTRLETGQNRYSQPIGLRKCNIK